MIELYNINKNIENKNLSIQTNFWNNAQANLGLGAQFYNNRSSLIKLIRPLG